MVGRLGGRSAGSARAAGGGIVVLYLGIFAASMTAVDCVIQN